MFKRLGSARAVVENTKWLWIQWISAGKKVADTGITKLCYHISAKATFKDKMRCQNKVILLNPEVVG